MSIFSHTTQYLRQMSLSALACSGIECPRFDTYVDKLVAFVEAHPEVSSKAMA
jgi:hypothetical protein